MKQIIWSNINPPEPDEWIREEYPDETEEELYRIAEEMNYDRLTDIKDSLDIDIGTEVSIGDLGLWYGRRNGYYVSKKSNLSNFLGIIGGDIDYAEFFVEDGEFKAVGIHHDGTNYYTFRELDETADPEDLDIVEFGTATAEQVIKVTKPLGAKVLKALGMA